MALLFRWPALFFTVIVAGLMTGGVSAHTLTLTEVDVRFAKDGTYEITVRCDLEAVAAGVKPGHLSAEDKARLLARPLKTADEKLLEERLLIEGNMHPAFDGTPDKPSIEFPTAEPGMLKADDKISLNDGSRTVILKGTVPADAKAFTWKSTKFGDVSLAVSREGKEEVFREPVVEGETSTPYPLQEAAEAPASSMHTAGKFFSLGYHHIVALDGLDHILFVVGLFLLSTHLKPLFWQVTAFTIAHSVTLCLSVFHIIKLPSGIVESLIALSIAYVAIENLVTQKLNWWRPLIVFCFGLMHGLGFAAGLEEAGIPKGALINALVSFNVGVEIGHLTIVAVAFLLVGWFREKPWYRKAIVIPGSSIIALMALFWFVQRTISMFTEG